MQTPVLPEIIVRPSGSRRADVQPSGVEGINRPIHQLTQVNLGLPIVDNGYLKDVAEVARRLQRWEFMTSIQINPVPGGTASPFNAHATF